MSKNNPPKSNSENIRLNKLIADNGLASRRQADRMIEEGQVIVNGKKVFELGIRVNPAKDRIVINGKPLAKSPQMKLYLAFNKPKGVLTTMEDPLERPTIADYLDKVPGRVFPVGRLDWDSEGLLLLTNDGDFAQKVTHPKNEVTKTYLVKIDGHPEQKHITKLLSGVSIPGGKVRAQHVEKIRRPDGSEKYDWYKIVITEGKNRQIRLMFEKIGFDVLKLQRVSIGRLHLGNLERGEIAYINENVLSKIFQPDAPKELKAKRGQHKPKQVSTKRAPQKTRSEAKKSFER